MDPTINTHHAISSCRSCPALGWCKVCSQVSARSAMWLNVGWLIPCFFLMVLVVGQALLNRKLQNATLHCAAVLTGTTPTVCLRHTAPAFLSSPLSVFVSFTKQQSQLHNFALFRLIPKRLANNKPRLTPIPLVIGTGGSPMELENVHCVGFFFLSGIHTLACHIGSWMVWAAM